ncbi:TolC family protein [Uliginosibacterium gangwonense]|uniref:TolC family protein n=1 Tax=Uliginosibacterium gangwonense TaxID=392736 RepID=UPI00035F91AB|nr:TolC family protein [Uliginosibacterium gangwonense]
MKIQARHVGGWILAALLSGGVYAAGPLTLVEAQQIAENRAPQLTAARAQETAAREMAVAARQLPDPVLKVGVNNVPVSGEGAWSLVQEGMTMRSVALMQEFTRGAKREARSDRASQEASLARVQQRLSLAEIRRETALSWFEVAYQERTLAFIKTQIDELDLQRQAGEAAFRAGRGEQADVMAARLAGERMRDQLAQMQRDIAIARARLTRWVGEDAARTLAEPPDIEHLSWQPAQLLEGIDSHPALSMRAAGVAVAEADVRVARENRKPDVSVELMYSQRGPGYPNMVSLNFSMPLPWDRPQRQDRELAAQLAKLDQAKAEQEDMLRSYQAELRASLAAWQADLARLQRYDAELIPLSRQQIDAAMAGYKAATGGLQRVLEARRMAVDTQMERQRVALDTARAWASLNYVNPREEDNPLASPTQGVQP